MPASPTLETARDLERLERKLESNKENGEVRVTSHRGGIRNIRVEEEYRPTTAANIFFPICPQPAPIAYSSK